jgi:hypothetical protein
MHQANYELYEDEMVRERSMHMTKRNAYSAVVGKAEGKRPLGILKI